MRNSQLLSIAVGLACFLWMLNFLGITPFFPFIANDLSTTVALLGQITGLVALVSVPIGMITGPLADRYGHRKVLLSGVGALSVGSFITAVAPSYGTLMLLVPFGAVGQAIIRPLSIAIAGTHLESDDRRRAVGLATVGMSLAGVIGIPILTTIGALGGWRASFGFLTAFNVVATIFLGLSIPADRKEPTESSSQRLGFPAYLDLFRDRSTMWLIGSTLLRAISLWGFYTYRGAFFVDRFKFSSQHVGWIFTIAGLGLFLGSTVASSRFSKFPLPRVTIFGIALMGLSAGLVLALPIGIALAIVFTTLTSFGLGFAMVAGDTLIVSGTHAGRATTTSLNRTAANIGTSIGSSGGGLMLALGGYPLLGISILVISLGALLLVWLSRPYHDVALESAT